MGASGVREGGALTLDVELDGGVGHAHHVLGDAGQLVVVVVSADVEQSQVDGVGGGVDVRLEGGDTHTQEQGVSALRSAGRSALPTAAAPSTLLRRWAALSLKTSSPRPQQLPFVR